MDRKKSRFIYQLPLNKDGSAPVIFSTRNHKPLNSRARFEEDGAADVELYRSWKLLPGHYIEYAEGELQQLWIASDGVPHYSAMDYIPEWLGEFTGMPTGWCRGAVMS
jgi:hypothetical protein